MRANLTAALGICVFWLLVFQASPTPATNFDHETNGIYIFPHGTVRPILTSRNRVFDITDPPFNATCDGVADDTFAIRAAFAAADTAGGGTILFPPRTCVNDTTTPYLKPRDGSACGVFSQSDNIIVRGRGPGSILRQNDTTLPGAMFCIRLQSSASGTDYLHYTPRYAMRDVAKGDRSIITATPSDAGNFTARDLVFLRGAGSHVSNSTGEINEVTASNSATGVVSLKYAVGMALTNDGVNPFGIVKVNDVTSSHWTFRDMTFEPKRSQFILAEQVRDLKLINLTVIQGQTAGSGPLQANYIRGLLIQGSYMSGPNAGPDPSAKSADIKVINNTFKFGSNAIAPAEHSEHIVIRGNNIDVDGTDPRPGTIPMAVHGGLVHDFVVADNIIHYTSSCTTCDVIEDQGNVSEDVVITGNTIFVSGASAGDFAIKTHVPNSLIDNNSVITSRGCFSLRGIGDQLTGNYCESSGTVPNLVVLQTFGTGYRPSAIGNTIRSTAPTPGASGLTVADGGAQAISPIVLGNSVDGNFSAACVTIESVGNDPGIVSFSNRLTSCATPVSHTSDTIPAPCTDEPGACQREPGW